MLLFSMSNQYYVHLISVCMLQLIRSWSPTMRTRPILLFELLYTSFSWCFLIYSTLTSSLKCKGHCKFAEFCANRSYFSSITSIIDQRFFSPTIPATIFPTFKEFQWVSRIMDFFLISYSWFQELFNWPVPFYLMVDIHLLLCWLVKRILFNISVIWRE